MTLKQEEREFLQSQADIDFANFEAVKLFLRGLKVQAAYLGNQAAVIAPTWLMSDNETLEDYLPDFEDEDLRSASLRDFACVPVYSINPFFKNPAIIYSNARANRLCPVEDDLTLADWFKPDHSDYFFASDLSVSGDSTGIAFVRRFPYAQDTFEVVFTKRIKATRVDEVDYDAIEQLIETLHLRGFRVKKIGFDQFQSHNTKTNLLKKDYDAVVITYADSYSCLRTIKELIISSHLIYGDCDDVFMGEASELQVINSKRVDHLQSGGIFNSKDVWDAVVNALFLCMEDTGDFEIETE